MTVDAEQAKVYQGGASVLLQGEVIVLRQGAGVAPMEVLTRDLWYFADREFAETDARVTIRDARGVTTGMGMTIDLNSGIVDLLATVRGEYVLE